MSWRTLSVLLVAVGALFWIGSRPATLSSLFTELDHSFKRTFYDRQISFNGLVLVEESQLWELLPEDSSSIWWRLYPQSIARLVHQHPYVESAEVSPCHWHALSCFNISIQERQTTLLARIGGVLWMVGADGGFVRPVLNQEEHAGLPVVEGAFLESASPELTRARLRYAQRVVPFLEEELGHRTRGLELRENGELVVRFVSLAPEFVFASEEGSFERLGKEVRRLRLLLRELGDSLDRVERVDMAFRRLAVVKLKAQDDEPEQDFKLSIFEKGLP